MPWVCHLQAWMQLFGELLTVFLIAAIALCLVQIAREEWDVDDVRRVNLYWISLAVLISLVIATIPALIPGVFGPTTLWCFIQRNTRWADWFLYAPVILVVMVSVFALTSVRHYQRVRAEEDTLFAGISVDDPIVSALPTVVALYLVAFTLIWIPIAGVMVYRQLHPTSGANAVNVTMAVCLPLRGLVDALVVLYQYHAVARTVEQQRQLHQKGVGRDE